MQSVVMRTNVARCLGAVWALCRALFGRCVGRCLGAVLGAVLGASQAKIKIRSGHEPPANAEKFNRCSASELGVKPVGR